VFDLLGSPGTFSTTATQLKTIRTNVHPLVLLSSSLLANSAIGFSEEQNAGNTVKALMDSLAPKAKVKRWALDAKSNLRTWFPEI